MKRFYVTFLLLLLVSSAAMTGLISSAAAMRGEAIEPTAVVLAIVSAAVFIPSVLLLVRSLYVLSGRAQPNTEGGTE